MRHHYSYVHQTPCARIFKISLKKGEQTEEKKKESDVKTKINTSRSFVVIHIDSFELQIRIAGVGPGGVDTVFVADDLLE
jgi:hypothetical protein